MIVLDTHAWIWYVSEDPQLSKAAKTHIRRAEALGVHPVSCWEVAMLSNNGRLKLSIEISKWVRMPLSAPKSNCCPLPLQRPFAPPA